MQDKLCEGLNKTHQVLSPPVESCINNIKSQEPLRHGQQWWYTTCAILCKTLQNELCWWNFSFQCKLKHSGGFIVDSCNSLKVLECQLYADKYYQCNWVYEVIMKWASNVYPGLAHDFWQKTNWCRINCFVLFWVTFVICAEKWNICSIHERNVIYKTHGEGKRTEIVSL